MHRSQSQRQSAAQDVISCSGQWLFGMLYFHMSPCYCVCVVHTLTAKPTKLCTKLWSTICTAGISPWITVSGELVFFKHYRGWETVKHSLPFALSVYPSCTCCLWLRHTSHWLRLGKVRGIWGSKLKSFELQAQCRPAIESGLHAKGSVASSWKTMGPDYGWAN